MIRLKRLDVCVLVIFDVASPQIVSEAAKLCKYSTKGTLSSREVNLFSCGFVVGVSCQIQTAIRLVLPGELAKHAVSEGTKSVTKYTSANA